jgi:uncharacterized protein with ParB-like and HNH nuclease domain
MTDIQFHQVGIGTALLHNRLAVPLNQREYSWEEEHVLALFQDIAAAIAGGKASYFLGTIVLTQGKGDALEVVDGQQRLATITILLAAMRDYFAEQNDALLIQSLNGFLFTVVRGEREIYPRLSLNVDDNEFFRGRILSPKGSQERKRAKVQRQSHERIEQAAKLAEQHVLNIVSPYKDSDRIDHLNTWVDFIEKNALVITLTVADDLNAYIMFETLNDRGLKTSQSDLVKNYLFAQTGDRLVEAQQKWALMVGALETLPMEDIVINFLRHFVISLYGHTREREVLQKIKERVIGKLRAIEYLTTMVDAANDYVAMLTSTHAKWNKYNPNIRRAINTLGILQMLPLRPLMLAVVRRFSDTQTEKAFRLFVVWSVRFLIAGGARSGSVEEAFAKVAAEISAGHVDTSEKMTQKLIDIIPSDIEFENRFAIARVSTNDIARYYLRALELNEEGGHETELILPEEYPINLEHILPQKPDDNWPSFDKSIVPTYYKRLGNMVLLKASDNSIIGNHPFSEKRVYYQKSAYLLTQMVGTRLTWESKDIDEYQKELAKRAVKIWPRR